MAVFNIETFFCHEGTRPFNGVLQRNVYWQSLLLLKTGSEGPVSVMTFGLLHFGLFGDFLPELKLYLSKIQKLVSKMLSSTRQTVVFFILDKYNLSFGGNEL